MQFFAGLEADGFARRDADLGAGARIAANAGFAGTHVEDAEAAQFDALALGERVLEGLEHCVDSRFSLVALQAGALNHLVNNVLFYQCLPPAGEVSELKLSVETFSIVVNAPGVP